LPSAIDRRQGLEALGAHAPKEQHALIAAAHGVDTITQDRAREQHLHVLRGNEAGLLTLGELDNVGAAVGRGERHQLPLAHGQQRRDERLLQVGDELRVAALGDPPHAPRRRRGDVEFAVTPARHGEHRPRQIVDPGLLVDTEFHKAAAVDGGAHRVAGGEVRVARDGVHLGARRARGVARDDERRYRQSS